MSKEDDGELDPRIQVSKIKNKKKCIKKTGFVVFIFWQTSWHSASQNVGYLCGYFDSIQFLVIPASSHRLITRFCWDKMRSAQVKQKRKENLGLRSTKETNKIIVQLFSGMENLSLNVFI